MSCWTGYSVCRHGKVCCWQFPKVTSRSLPFPILTSFSHIRYARELWLATFFSSYSLSLSFYFSWPCESLLYPLTIEARTPEWMKEGLFVFSSFFDLFCIPSQLLVFFLGIFFRRYKNEVDQGMSIKELHYRTELHLLSFSPLSSSSNSNKEYGKAEHIQDKTTWICNEYHKKAMCKLVLALIYIVAKAK